MKTKRHNWKRLALLRGAEIRNIKRERLANRGLRKGIDTLLKLLAAVDAQGRNGTGWEEHGRRFVKELLPP